MNYLLSRNCDRTTNENEARLPRFSTEAAALKVANQATTRLNALDITPAANGSQGLPAPPNFSFSIPATVSRGFVAARENVRFAYKLCQKF